MNVLNCNITYKAEKCRQIIINHLLEDYSKGEEFAKILREQYYSWVYYSGVRNTGYMSNDVFNNKNSSFTEDHYLSPRLVISAIIENNIALLYNKELFYEVFNMSREIIKVTKTQNNDVRFANKNNERVIKELTVDKYDKFGPWWNVDSVRKKVISCSKEFPLKESIPDWFTEHEKKYLPKR